MNEDNDKIKIKPPEDFTIDEKTYPQAAQANNQAGMNNDVNPEPPVQPMTTISQPLNQSVPKKDHKARNIFIAVVAFALISVGVATGAAIISSKEKEQDNTPQTSEKQSENTAPISELKIAGNSMSDFDLEFLKIENEPLNKIYSPLSIKYTLAMLRDGAANETKAQIENLIGDYQPKLYLNNENRSLANGLFVRDSFQESILSSYTDDIKTKYAAEVIADPFVNANGINSWINEKTFGIIPKLVMDDVVQGSDFILANALAIDMNWNNQIQCAMNNEDIPCIKYSISYNHEKYSDSINTLGADRITGKVNYETINFNGSENNVITARIGASINNYDIIKELGEEYIRDTVKKAYAEWLAEADVKAKDGIEQNVDVYVEGYMKELAENYGKVGYSTDFTLLDNEEVKVFAKDLKEYDGDTLQYVGIMPKKASLADYTKGLSAEEITKIINNLKPIEASNFKQGVVTRIKGNIPFYDFTYELQLKKDLQSLGVEDVFDREKADLSNLTSEKSNILDAIHVANIDFSNNGIRAAAVTALAGLGGAGAGFRYDWDVPIEEIDMTFDKPFLFLIRDKSSGEVWFTGTVYEPSVNA
ncbi:hypothetical protein IJ114_03405 [Candidatus Saccharibacteria bacterium]|nr:hypothetical protein [Candidatus Saccharibacteria bacterium]